MKYAAKNKTRITLRITKNNLQDEELSDELFLEARQKQNKIWLHSQYKTDIKLSKALLLKINQLGGFLGLLY